MVVGWYNLPSVGTVVAPVPHKHQAQGRMGWTEVGEPGLRVPVKAEDFSNSRGQIYLPIP